MKFLEIPFWAMVACVPNLMGGEFLVFMRHLLTGVWGLLTLTIDYYFLEACISSSILAGWTEEVLQSNSSTFLEKLYAIYLQLSLMVVAYSLGVLHLLHRIISRYLPGLFESIMDFLHILFKSIVGGLHILFESIVGVLLPSGRWSSFSFNGVYLVSDEILVLSAVVLLGFVFYSKHSVGGFVPRLHRCVSSLLFIACLVVFVIDVTILFGANSDFMVTLCNGVLLYRYECMFCSFIINVFCLFAFRIAFLLGEDAVSWAIVSFIR